MSEEGPEFSDPYADPMRPPDVPKLVVCIHCGEEFESWKMQWQVRDESAGDLRGIWCCPTPGCGGAGYLFDIFPVDPADADNDGWVEFDDDEDLDDAADGLDDWDDLADDPDQLVFDFFDVDAADSDGRYGQAGENGDSPLLLKSEEAAQFCTPAMCRYLNAPPALLDEAYIAELLFNDDIPF